MASSTGTYPFSAAALMDPKIMKQRMATGIPTSLEPSRSVSRSASEQPLSASCNAAALGGLRALPYSKDDAYDLIQGQAKKPSTPTQQQPSGKFDPRQLLDPKGADKHNRVNTGMDEVATNSLSHLDSQDFEMNGISNATPSSYKREAMELQGVSSYVEKLHGVTQREERPVKKQKRGDGQVDDKKKATFAGGGARGDLGQYMKDKKKEGLEEIGVETAVVDLTEADDADEVVVVSDSSTREVCYGRIEGVKVSAHQLPFPSGKSVFFGGNWPVMKLNLKRLPGKDCIIRVIDPMSKDFGNVDVRTSIGLARIMDSRNPRFRVQAKLPSRRRKQTELPGQECSEYFDMIVNLYGPNDRVEQIGNWLSKKQIWLRQPFTSDAGIEICNPHQPATAAARISGMSHTSSAVSSGGQGYVTRTVEEIRSDVIGMFDALQQSEILPEVEADERITTALLSHQKQGLYFLQDKEKRRVYGEQDEENNSLWRLRYGANGRQSYYNIITGQEEQIKPPEVLGGILADMMGLGKTLSILALVVGSLDDAKHFGKQAAPVDGEKRLARNSKTTLLVCPLSTLANWEDQIASHIKPGTLKYYIYHGSSRISDIDQLATYDMVITTYSIVSSEIMRRSTKKDISPLERTNFFRIVLDEAHMIREQATRQSQAICSLSAERRWAVTGTPVQNRLDDLGALIKFLRVKPFSIKGGFAHYILSPFKNSDPDILPKLRILVDSFTLRRLKDRINLPGRYEAVEKLTFTDEELRLYEWFARDSQSKLKIIANDRLKSLGGKTYAHILRAIMRLRLICAHGRELLSEEDLKITEGFSRDNAIDLDDDDNIDTPALTARQAYEMLMLAQETGSDRCVSCNKTVESKAGVESDESDDDTGPETIGCMLPCYQLLCRDCMVGVKASLIQSSADHHFKCPFCEMKLRTSFFELTQSGAREADETRALARQNPRQAKILGRYGGPHTKVRALIQSLTESAKESQSLPKGEAPIKSVVFSGWTSYLDLIQIALEEEGIKCARLDGRMSRKNRNASLEALREDPETRVILISIMAGGLGLNLTSASKVYVMEPQFNPAAEAQAVDRVHRLGQTREVFITRYIMDNSFEGKMLQLQERKKNLAKLSMDRGKLDKAEAAKAKLDDLRCLFK